MAKLVGDSNEYTTVTNLNDTDGVFFFVTGHVATATGTATKAFFRCASTGQACKILVYNSSRALVSSATIASTVTGWNEVTLSPPVSIPNTTDTWYLGAMGATANEPDIYVESASGYDLWKDTSGSYASPPDPLGTGTEMAWGYMGLYLDGPAIAFRSAASQAYAGGGSTTIDKPSGVVNGDIMVAVIYHENDTMATVPENWTLISHVDAGGASISSYWKRAASEGTNYTWNATTNNIGGSIAAYSGCLESGSPIDTSSENTGTNSTLTWTGITTTVDNAMLVALMMKVSGGTTADASTATSPLTNNERTDVDGTGVFDGLQASLGSSGNKTVTLSGWIQWAAHLVALKPATDGVVPLTARPGEIQVGASYLA